MHVNNNQTWYKTSLGKGVSTELCDISDFEELTTKYLHDFKSSQNC